MVVEHPTPPWDESRRRFTVRLGYAYLHTYVMGKEALEMSTGLPNPPQSPSYTHYDFSGPLPPSIELVLLYSSPSGKEWDRRKQRTGAFLPGYGVPGAGPVRGRDVVSKTEENLRLRARLSCLPSTSKVPEVRKQKKADAMGESWTGRAVMEGAGLHPGALPALPPATREGLPRSQQPQCPWGRRGGGVLPHLARLTESV